MTGNESRPGLLAPLGRHALLLVLYGLAGIVVAGFAGFIYLGVSGKPDLKSWHTATLNEDFTRADGDRIDSVAAYRALEDRLFEELLGLGLSAQQFFDKFAKFRIAAALLIEVRLTLFAVSAL